MTPEFKSGLQRDDKSPTRSTIADSPLFSLSMSYTSLELISVPRQIRTRVALFRDALQNAGLKPVAQRVHSTTPGQKYPFNADAISPATQRTLERDVAVISLENSLAAHSQT